MLIGLLRLLARVPLRWVHAAGGLLGWIAYLGSPTYAARLRENLRQSGLWKDERDYQRILRANVSQAGKAVLELVPVWFLPKARATALALPDDAGPLIEKARARGKGVIFLTPHLGCPDMAALCVARHVPLTVLYRPPKKEFLHPLVQAGRRSERIALAPTSVQGVRLLLRALKRGDCVGILPDQAPSMGDGAWATFFGRPAYTMTLVGRLVEATGAAVIMTFARRLPYGRGYAFDAVEVDPPPSGANAAQMLNAAVEDMVARCPEQYLWAYNRYKVPAGARPPESPSAGSPPT